MSTSEGGPRAPCARRRDLIVRELADEAVVYDERTSRAHCLNATALRVFRACDGTRTPGDLARELALDAKVVELALDLLARARLLEERPARSPDADAMSRRQALSLIRAASLGVAIPTVASIVAPTVAQAASCVPRGGTCGHFDLQRCCPGLRCTSDRCQ